jgi:DNA-binding CsgD family transcriptional regulator
MAPRGSKLSKREREVIAAIAYCGDQKRAAIRLGIADQTVKNHLTTAYRRLGVHGIIDALYALGWLRVPNDLRALGSDQPSAVLTDGRSSGSPGPAYHPSLTLQRLPYTIPPRTE